ncbi:MAG: hypothetical protein KBC84_05330 [Proteobacteria bacterium]|nr:hypothetical protein [Pseudomonadota bacterium]
MNNTKGNIALYALFILPFSLTLLSLVFDYNAWNAERNSTQLRADQLAFQLGKLLPNKTAIGLNIEKIRINDTYKDSLLEVSYPEESLSNIKVRVSTKYQPSFTSLFANLLASSAFTISRESVVQVVPTDYIIIATDGNSLRPRKTLSVDGSKYQIDEPWSDPSEWPESGYFNCVAAPVINSSDSKWQWWKLWDNKDYQRWATQSCFNPIYSSYKSSLIELTQHITLKNADRLGFIFTPGKREDNGFTKIRSLKSNLNINPLETAGFFSPKGPQAIWSNYQETEDFLGDESCVLMSEPISALNTFYELNNKSDFTEKIIAYAPCGTRHFPQGNLNNNYLVENLQLKEAIYYHAARQDTEIFKATPDVKKSLVAAFEEFLLNNNENNVLEEKTRRGNLSSKAKKKIILISDFLTPLDEDLVSLFSQIVENHIEVNFIIFQHKGLTSEEVANLRYISTAYKSLFTTKQNLSLFEVNNFENLNQMLQLALINKQELSLKQ